MGPHNVLPLLVRMNVRVMAIKEYFTHPKLPEHEPHHQSLLSITPRTPFICGSLTSLKGYKVKFAIVVKGNPKASFSIHQDVGRGATLFPGLINFTLDMYLIMLSVKQGGINYHFLSLWYDSTWD